MPYTTSRHDLSNQIRKVVKAIHSTGLKVIATICDQGATNTAAINLLKADTRVNCLRKNIDYNDLFYEVDCGTEVITLVHLFDPPHLLKRIRNNFLNKNVRYVVNRKTFNNRKKIFNQHLNEQVMNII
ncbi:Transposable element P transposase [Aphis craccivora]|uniref:Transposable element P transposase n=1 Tax=Aphis craccivora TaxID=307492 RepID=A0A6G0VM58_APHCR|nr:Transposable element P transposase [Aphis craccivora]